MTGEVEGFVLAGGTSSRFGSNKALASWRGVPMLGRALHVLEDIGLTGRIVCSDPLPFGTFYHPFVLGERPGRGPAEGLRTALLATAAPWALLLAVDMPEVGPGVLRALLQARIRGGPATGDRAPLVFEDGERVHPFPGLYPRGLLEMLDRLGEGVSLQRVLEEAGARRVPWDPARSGGETLRNVNAAGDLESAS
jgi:molybdopterin-guanine dinucleotide biosynthesis protein A